MGDCLSVQYGGSEAHSQFFHKQRGDWNATVQSRDFMTSVRRFYSNTVSDAEKQHAMNLFLGHFVPEPGKPAVWELESDSFLHAGAGAQPSKCSFPSLCCSVKS
jgi:phosphatidylinositol 3,5-bisphosphate 5-phosphatase